ncbi:MAG: DNA cytosine methyltransferase [Ruminococcus sp.]|nr:DNA cytosine methyltransferase [Ruminococcus sp.]
MKVIDLFAGCGGLSLGFLQAGFLIDKAVEYDPVIANTYQKNYPEIDVLVDDIKNIDMADVFKQGDAEIIIGGPPCQGFSMAGARIRHDFIDDPRNYLFMHYFNVVKTVKPKIFIMENVKGMQNMQKGKIFKEILSIFSDAEMNDGCPYNVFYKVIKAVDFGIPQKRERLIIIGTTVANLNFEDVWEETRHLIMEEYPDYFTKTTVRDAIGNLPPVTESGIIENPVPQNQYQRYLACDKEKLLNHMQSRHSAKAVERMRKIDNGQNYIYLDEEINSVHSGSYGRLIWDEPAATITTRFDTPAGGRFIHPDEDRTLSPREAARIQSFPDDFVFYGARREISRQIGNAVPPKISYFLARLIQIILERGE